jgi:MFS family permease
MRTCRPSQSHLAEQEPTEGSGLIGSVQPAGADGSSTPWLSGPVAGVSAASFLSDTGHEMTTAILPSFFVAILHASASALGLVEGISDGLMGVAKLATGPLANQPSRRGRLASGGYLGTAIATGLIGVTAAVWQVGILRALAWIARGVRSPARDTILATLVSPRAYGRAFGLERAGDNLGAVAGPLLAAGLITWIGIRPTLCLAVIPGLFAAIAITVAARSATQSLPAAGGLLRVEFGRLQQAGLLRPMVPVAAFELGNVATTLLIFRATQQLQSGGLSITAAASLAILIYAAHNAVGAAVAALGGHWVDRSGPRIVFATAATLYVVAYIGFALPGQGWSTLLVAFTLAGSGIGLAETAESTLVARALPDELRGSGFGLLGGVQAAGDFASSAVVGLLYALLSPVVGFAYAAGWMLVAVLGSAQLGARRQQDAHR